MKLTALLPFLLLLFVGTACSSMIVPFMGFFLVEGLGRDPWTISVYSALAVCLTVTVNRLFARRIDAGSPVSPLIGMALGGYLAATLALSVSPALWTVMTIGVLGFGVSSSAISTMFSLGGVLAQRREIERSRFNAWMRATTSTAWMVGPALSFFVADRFGEASVFKLCAALALVWLVLWRVALPRDITAEAPPRAGADGETERFNTGLWLSVAFVFCLSTAHSLTFAALPLFYVREVGLPGYAPGTAFSIKTFVEVFAIFSTPFLIARFGLWRSLMATTLLAVVTIQVLAAVSSFPQMLAGAALEGLYYGLYASLGISFVQSFAAGRPARATAIYWNAMMVTGILAGPAVGVIAQLRDFATVIQVASAVAACAALILFLGGWQTRRRSATAA